MAQTHTREMREETMARSPSASIVFVSVAAICLVTGLYASAFKNLMVTFLLILIPLNNLIRTIPFIHWKTHGQITERMWQLFCVGAVKNGLIWGGVIALGISSNADSHWATTFYLLI
ncbi:MAG: hypothetical protein K2P92_07210, partial [Bdellovibrionaceae bacterium]|nr:hypothetical protein [Pseudobdellovibrionaceae bacterium]